MRGRPSQQVRLRVGLHLDPKGGHEVFRATECANLAATEKSNEQLLTDFNCFHNTGSRNLGFLASLEDASNEQLRTLAECSTAGLRTSRLKTLLSQSSETSLITSDVCPYDVAMEIYLRKMNPSRSETRRLLEGRLEACSPASGGVA